MRERSVNGASPGVYQAQIRDLCRLGVGFAEHTGRLGGHGASELTVSTESVAGATRSNSATPRIQGVPTVAGEMKGLTVRP